MSAKKQNGEKAVRRNLTFPPSFVAKLEALKGKRGGVSDSEILRQAIVLLEAVADRDSKVVLVDKAGKQTEILVP